MNTPLDSNVRRNLIVVALLVVIAIFGIFVLIPSYAVKTISSIIAFTIAIAWPVHQKRLSFHSLLLVIIGLLFLLSGVIGNAADSFLSSLSISSQIEFSRIMRPKQLSTGLWNVGVGLGYVLLAWLQWTSSRNKLQRSKVLLWASPLLGILGVLFIILGVSAIINGWSQL